MMPSDDPDANHHLHHLCAEDRIREQVDYSSRFSQDLVDADDIVVPSSPYDDDFLPPLPHNLLPDFAAGLWDVAPSSSSSPAVGSDVNGDHLSVRRSVKADREKMRRDKLNEQFLELASSLELDRLKNDKATILVESIQLLKDLRAEVKRLKTQHESLLEESRDLKQERKDLREEKETLKKETNKLQSQIQECSMPWMGLSRMTDDTPYPYPLPLHHSYQTNPPTDSNTIAGQTHPMLPPNPYMPIVGGGTFHVPVPSGCLPYPIFGGRSGDVGIHPYSPYPTFSHSLSHVERPYAQYPSPLHPVPGYIPPPTTPTSEHQRTSTNLSSNASLCSPQNLDLHQSRRRGASKSCGVAPHQDGSARVRNPVTQEKEDDAGILTPEVLQIEPNEHCILPTNMKTRHAFASSESDLYIVMDGNKLSGKSLSELESEIELDAILRPPAA